MKKESFAIILLSLILSATGCDQKAHDETSETPAAGSQAEGVKISQDTDVQAPIDADNSKDSNALNSAEVPKDDGHVSAQNTDELPNIDTDKPGTVQLSDGKGTNQIKSDKVFVHYCHEETCPCGDAACSQNSYCIMNTCIKFFEAAKPNSEEITQEELDNLDVTYCEEGNCSCGEGFCSKGGYCIIDTCICGDLKDCIDDNIISNNYGEFECYTQYAEESEESEESEEECQGCGCEDEYKANEPQVLYRDFICTRKKGCKTADGREFERTKSDGDDYERDYIALDSEYSHSACQKYAKLKQEYELREGCGEKLFPDPEYLYPDGDFSHMGDNTYPECDLRKEFKRSGITKEHLSEYAWFIGKDYYYPCGSGAPFNTEYHDMLVGLRCIHPEGCVCGDTHCPEYALCKDGACIYDLYYQHRVCPGDKWDPDESDSTNYILSIGEPCNCDDEDYEDYKDVCYDDCYWGLYDSKMTRDDPCVPKDELNQNPESEGHQPFKFTITTDIKPENKEVTIPILPGTIGKYPFNYDLDCDGDGEYEYTGLTMNATCKYSPNTGKHQISVRGNLTGILLCVHDSDSDEAVISVDSWGDIQWKSMRGFASECKVLNQLPKAAPNLSEVTDMSYMFKDTSSFNQSIEHWDVSHVTNMSGLFDGASSFNRPLEKWNVSNVTDMSRMFTGAKSFNQPLEKWNVSNVTNMSQMFSAAVAFNQPLENWNVSRVTYMTEMFDGAKSFNHPLEKWDVSNVEDMFAMFRNARAFNQPLEKWNVSKVTSMNEMFSGAVSFNQPLENWDVSNVTSMRGMFKDAKSFDQPLEKWNVSNVTFMMYMFKGASSFSHYPQNWVIPGKYAGEMFTGTRVEQLAKDKPLQKKDVDE